MGGAFSKRSHSGSVAYLAKQIGVGVVKIGEGA